MGCEERSAVERAGAGHRNQRDGLQVEWTRLHHLFSGRSGRPQWPHRRAHGLAAQP